MKLKNHDGERHGYFTVVKRLNEKKNGQYLFLCRCDCGKEFKLRAENIHTQMSCGCMANKLISESKKKHGEAGSRLYEVWRSMKARCNRPNDRYYKNYGGRGIKVCPEWNDSYENFAKWARENGYDDNAEFMKCTIERIDPNKGYDPLNCIFTDIKAQSNNRTNNRRLSFNGETHTVAEWSEITGLKYGTINSRLRYGWSVEDTLTRRKKIWRGK